MVKEGYKNNHLYWKFKTISLLKAKGFSETESKKMFFSENVLKAIEKYSPEEYAEELMIESNEK